MKDKPHPNREWTEQSVMLKSPEQTRDKQTSVSTVEFRRLFDRSGSFLTLRLMELLPVAVYICEAPSGVITYYNSRAAKLWGRAPIVGDTDESFGAYFRLFRPDGTPLSHLDTPMAQVLNVRLPFEIKRSSLNARTGPALLP
jgi:hypothetical protein